MIEEPFIKCQRVPLTVFYEHSCRIDFTAGLLKKPLYPGDPSQEMALTSLISLLTKAWPFDTQCGEVFLIALSD